MSKDLLFNPRTYDPAHFDPETRRLLRATVDWFETRGKKALISSYIDRVWYADFLEFAAKEGLFATFLTPAADAAGDAGQALGYRPQRSPQRDPRLLRPGLLVHLAGHHPRPRPGVAEREPPGARPRRRPALRGPCDGLRPVREEPRRRHLPTDMVLSADGKGGFRANGSKYYIGNGNVAGLVSVFGRRSDIEGPDGYVFFAADSRHPNYHLVQNVVNSQMFVSEFLLKDYPVRAEDVMHTGQGAFDAALNTVNVGKFNLCAAGVGICEHAMYEAVTHAYNRILYGSRVTDFPHVRRELTDAYARLAAMKLFSDRAADYFRSADPDDRRYLLFNPMTKMKVTTESEKVIDLMWDVIAAKGFEKDTYFDKAARDIRGLPKLEGTVHVNLALIQKFMGNYLFNPAEYAPVPTRLDAADDTFVFHQGPARGLGAIRFHDWRIAYDRSAQLPNVARFREQADGLCELLSKHAPDHIQLQDLDFSLTLSHLFALVVYGQLVLEQAELTSLEPDLLDEIFDVLIRDFSGHATDLHGKAAATDAQTAWALANIRRPAADAQRFARVWSQVEALSGVYEMQP